jgi:hypothetical protein
MKNYPLFYRRAKKENYITSSDPHRDISAIFYSIIYLKYANTHCSKASATFCVVYSVFGETDTSMVHLISA